VSALELPAAVASLFWEIDPESLVLPEHRDYVLERVLGRGGWEAMQWARNTFSHDELVEFLTTKGSRLPPRERAYWSVVCGVQPPTERGGGRPGWAGP
jgi:hypothetical protein